MASTAASRGGSAKAAEQAGPAGAVDMSEVVRELAAVAAYIGHIKREIAALRDRLWTALQADIITRTDGVTESCLEKSFGRSGRGTASARKTWPGGSA